MTGGETSRLFMLVHVCNLYTTMTMLQDWFLMPHNRYLRQCWNLRYMLNGYGCQPGASMFYAVNPMQ